MTTFLRRAVARPDLVGAPAPTGHALAARIAGVVPSDRPVTVVELGAGTGAITPAIRARLAPGSRLVAVEVDPGMVTHLRARLPWLDLLDGDAADLPQLLAGAGVGPVDAVVSSLPWTLFGRSRRRAMLAGVAATMTPGGVFATISTLTAAPQRVRALRHELGEVFGEVTASAPVWRNVPPARLLIGRNPSC